MSTPNFYSQDNFKLYIRAYEPMSIEEYRDEIFECNEGYEEYMETDNEVYKKYLLEKSYNSYIEMDNYWFYDDIISGYDGFKDLMEDFTDSLTFHKLEFRDGYYSGIQIYVEEKENPYELDNEDCNYYFDMCRSKAIRKYDSEIKKINKWLDKTAVAYGWRQLLCLGIFGNGEAVYRYADSLIKPMQKK